MCKDAQPLRGLRVLLAEDEPLIALFGHDALRSAGTAHVEIAANVAQAFQSVEYTRPDAALLDVRLGAELTTDLARRLALLQIPFGFLTGYSRDAIPADMRDHPILVKPYREEELVSMVCDLVGRGDLQPSVCEGSCA